MQKREVNILSEKSIDRTIDAINGLEEYLTSPKTIEALTKLAYETVKKNVGTYSSNHISNIFMDFTGNEGRVYTNDEVLIYNEYGTGIVGYKAPHPNTINGKEIFRYNTEGQDGKGGWWYEENGDWHYTQGLPARQGFYLSREELKNIASKDISLAIEKIFVKK